MFAIEYTGERIYFWTLENDILVDGIEQGHPTTQCFKMDQK